MAGWHHRCNESELGQTLGDGEGQGGLACCSPWSHGVGHDWETEQQQKQSARKSQNCLNMMQGKREGACLSLS